ncbi:hypothetical protein Tco_1091840 [Tanacetum coccineum]|uniref:Reverse transcriptase Ty1/copia-type domain-containing protein n=1 Tax=Tanacetum coccineum TaxID=301880 RepID=A0ABQ5IAI6_9ASTR
METSDLVDTPMVEKSKPDVDPQGKEVDPTRYHGMIGSLMYLNACRPNLIFDVFMCARYQAKPIEKNLHVMLTMLVAKILEEVHLEVCSYWVKNKYHFIKEQVENGVVELYFVRTKYQLANIFIKALGRESLDFLINKLGMRSMSPETMKRLAKEEEEEE